MAIQQNRKSRSKRGMRNAHRRLKKPAVAKCLRCQQAVQPHRVCSNCGYYGKRKVVQVKEE